MYVVSGLARCDHSLVYIRHLLAPKEQSHKLATVPHYNRTVLISAATLQSHILH